MILPLYSGRFAAELVLFYFSLLFLPRTASSLSAHAKKIVHGLFYGISPDDSAETSDNKSQLGAGRIVVRSTRSGGIRLAGLGVELAVQSEKKHKGWGRIWL